MGATDAIGSIVIDDTSVAIKFTSPDPSNYFVGPFETPWVDIVFGKGTENKYEYSASNIWFRKDVDTGETKSYMSGVGYTGTGPEQFSITKIRFGELNDTTVQVSFSNVIIVFDSGYTVKVGEQTTSISYVDISALTLATLHTSFGVGTADDAVVIRCYKENDVMYTENTVRIESVLAAVRLPGDDDTDSKFLCGYIGKNLSSATDLATVYTKEDAGHYAILRTVTGLSTSMYISQGGAEGEQYYSVSATDFNIDIDESLTDDPLKSVSVGQVCFVSTESAFEFNNFHKT